MTALNLSVTFNVKHLGFFKKNRTPLNSKKNPKNQQKHQSPGNWQLYNMDCNMIELLLPWAIKRPKYFHFGNLNEILIIEMFKASTAKYFFKKSGVLLLCDFI